jgi:signal transduction histidine kinase
MDIFSIFEQNLSRMNEKKISVYVAEDDPLSGKMMNITIKRIGFEFLGLGTDTDTVIKEVGELKPDVVLMDIDMPGAQDGIGAAEIIKEKYQIPVIYVTANSEDSVFDRALKTSPFGYVLKPVTRDNLRTVVEMGYARAKLDKALKEKQAELRELNDALEEKVKERTKEIHEKNKQLETALIREKELNEFQTRIVTTISHEFRTPMTTIMSSAEIMERLINTNKPKEKIFRHTNLVKSSVQELIELLNDILLIEKFDSGRYEIIKEEIDLDQYFEDLQFKLEIGIGKNHTRNLNIQPSMGHISTDRKLFSQILNNILSNAFKYSQKESTVYIIASTDDHFLHFSVRDEGIGMNPETLSMIFDSFYRAKNVTNIEGTGMGLSILKKSVDMLNGEIDVESEEGKGTIFKVKIPLE